MDAVKESPDQELQAHSARLPQCEGGFGAQERDSVSAMVLA